MKFLTIIFSAFIFTAGAFAQDVQFSQYYAAPLYLNPAFAGTTHHSRAVLNYRNQWPGVAKPFIAYAASFDHYFANANSGAGLMFMRSKEGSSALRSTEISGFYSYHLQVSENLTIVPGLQASYVVRDLDYFNLTFPEQYNNSGLTGSGNTEDFNYSKRSYIDLSTGGLAYTENFWIGLAVNHLNKPDQSFISGQSPLPRKFSIHTGYKINLADTRGRTSRGNYREQSLTPTLLYKSQGKYDQFDAGLYLINEPLMFGLWYRGIPVKHYAKGFQNNESLVMLAGYHYQKLAVAYSFDFILSSLSNRSAGAHEISLTYEFGEDQEHIHKKRKGPKRLPCPKFYYQ